MRVEELLFRHAARRPRHAAVVCGNRRVTYEENSRAGERVAIQLPNGIEFVEQAYAAWAVAAFVQPRPGAKLSAESVIEHCRALLAGFLKSELRKQAVTWDKQANVHNCKESGAALE